MGGPGSTQPRRWQPLATELLLALVSAWGIGVLYGMSIQRTGNWHEGAEWERSILRWFHQSALPSWLDSVVLAIPLTGTNLTLLPALLVVGWWLWKRRGRPQIAAHLLVVSVGSLVLNAMTKYQLGRERPDLFPRRGMYNWASYPSGHAIVTTALFFTAALILYRRRGWRWPFAAATVVLLANAYSRLYLAVHWPTDILGGVLMGLVWLVGTWGAFTRDAARAGDALAGTEPAKALAVSSR